MAEGHCAKCSRYLLIVFNFLFWVCGGALLGIGLWLRFDDGVKAFLYKTLQLDQSLPEDFLHIAAYILIATGGFIFIIGFCGCCGAIRESYCMLGVYIACLIIIILAELSAGIYLAVERPNLENKLHRMLLTDVHNYTITANSSSLDYLQQQFKCCGSKNYSEYEDSIEYTIKYNQKPNSWFVPESCCKGYKPDGISNYADIDKCQNEAKTQTEDPEHLHAQGCHTVILDLFITNSAVLIGVAGGIACFGILGIIFASILCRNRTEYYDWE